MTSAPESTGAKVESLQERADGNLRFIRSTLERAGSFTAVPGWGGMVMGIFGVGAAVLARRQTTFDAWLFVWMVTAITAAAAGAVAMWWKARATKTPIVHGPGRKFILALCPPILAAVPITAALAEYQQPALLAGIWLLLYGAAVTAAGAFSIRVVPALGLCFMLLGGGALLMPVLGPDAWLGLGFGGLHLVFGMIIGLRHGG